MTTAQDQQSRAEFEAWASNDGAHQKAIQRNGDGYLLAITQSFWHAWQAARALPAGMEPVYQVSQPFPADPANTWRDASEGAYDVHMPDRRRILYTAAQVQAMGRVPPGWHELAQRCLIAMEAAVHFGETGKGRPPQQTCLFEIEELRTMLAAAPRPPAVQDVLEIEHSRREAESLAWSLFNKHYAQGEDYTSGRSVFGLFDSLRGVLSQIDNMTAGLVRDPAAQERKPLTDERIREIDDETHFHESPSWPLRFARAIETEIRKASTP